MRIIHCIMLTLACGTLMAAPAFRLSKDNPLSIAVSEAPTPAEKTAAAELHEFLQKLCGADCSISTEKDVKAPAIYLGWTETAKKAAGDLSKFADEEWFICAKDGSLILSGGRPRGTIYAVYEFLEGQGIVWADETTEYVPSLKEIRIDKPVTIKDKPALLGRNVYTQMRQPTKPSTQFYMRNKLNHYHTIPEEYGYGFSMGRPGNCHTFHAFSKPEWPDEWFMMNKNGKRIRSTSSSGPGQFCLTNPELRKAMVERLKEFIAKDREGKSPEGYPKIYDISHNDTDAYCVCPSCKAIVEREGSAAGLLLDFINYIANAVADEYPDILIQTFAYMWSLDAPKTIKPAKNVMMRVCKLGCEFLPSGKADTMFPVTHPRNKDYYENFLKWAAISKNIAVWDYWIIYTKGDTTPPYINLPTMQQDIKFYSDHNVKTLFVEFENPLNTTFTYFRLWYGLKLMQNPDSSYDMLVRRYFNAYYGPAAKPMRQYMEYLQKRLTDSDACLGRSQIGFKILLPNKIDTKKLQLLPYLDKEFFERSNVLLDKAESLVENNPVFLQHVRKERMPVDVALLYSFSQYPSGKLPVGKRIDGTFNALLDRYTDYRMEQARRLFDSDIYPKRPEKLKEIMDFKEMLQKNSGIDKSVIPEEFRNKQCLFLRADDWHGVNVTDDDSPSKYPMMLKNETYKLVNSSPDKFHKLPFEIGIYNKRKELFQTTKKIPEKDIPQDGKYHWIHMGRHEIMPSSILWVHWSWHLQMPLDAAYLGDKADNTWDIYAAVKLTGKPYIKGSTEEGKVFLDSILLVK